MLGMDASVASLTAFPGAEGFGAVASGGRKGRVIKVTNHNSSGPGSFAAAAAAEGPRIVVFDVAGLIRGDVAIRHPYITIAGQTAPSPGITLEGRLLARPSKGQRLHDVIVRFLRVRPRRADGHGGDAVQLPNSERVILDHLSLSWATDEVIDIIHSSDVTVQWCTVEESDVQGHDKGAYHNLALISAYPGSGNISIHHNLFAHHSGRIPSLSPREPGKPGDFRNNVVYDFREGLTHDGHKPYAGISLVGNYYKPGPSSVAVFPFRFRTDGEYYLAENYLEGVGEIQDPRAGIQRLPGWILVSRDGKRLNRPVSVAAVTTHTAREAYALVLARAGAWPRDRITRRTVAEVEQGLGNWGRNAPLAPEDVWFFAGLPWDRVASDGDGDGVPDDWEESNGLDMRDPDDFGTLMSSGHTAIEAYLNERADQLLGRRAESQVRDLTVLPWALSPVKKHE